MQTIKILCSCGQKFAFEVEPVSGQMPFPVTCPACGADGTEAANQVLAQSARPPPVLQNSQMPSDSGGILRPTGQRRPGNGNGSQTELPAIHQQLTAEEAKSGAWASNPGRLRPDWKQVLRAWPSYWQMPLIIVVASGLGGWLAHPYCFFGLALAAWSVWDGYREITSLLMNGDVCAGIVISERPERVAVQTNLSAQGEQHPAVRVLEQPILKAAAHPLCAGTRVATVAFYHGPLTPTGDWKSFAPMVINTLVSNPAEIQRVLNSIPEEDWYELDNHVARLPSQQEGLYAMWGPKPSAIEVVSKGEKRGFRAWIVVVTVLGVVTAATVILLSPKRSANTAPSSGNSFRPGALPTPPPAFERSLPNVGRQPGPANTGRTGLAGIAVGDKVEVRDIRTGRWSAAAVVEFDGFRFRVRFDDGSTPDEWLTRGQLRLRR